MVRELLRQRANCLEQCLSAATAAEGGRSRAGQRGRIDVAVDAPRLLLHVAEPE